MFLCGLFYFVTVSSLFVGIKADTRVAVAQLLTANISGTITFTEVAEGIRVEGRITGLPAGEYGFHIHELGDVSTCDATGAHFDLDGNDHGGPEHTVRHIGDFGNIRFAGETDTVVGVVNFVDTVITLRGRNSILGRALVLHEGTDDLGLGGHETSLTTGNAGARVACGVIGIKAPAVWDAAASIGPSTVLLSLIASLYFIRYY